LGLVAYAMFVFLTVPAAYVAARVRDETQGAVLLTDTHGSLWSGGAKARVSPPRGAAVEIDALTWRLRTLRLFSGRLAYEVRVESSGLTGDLEAARAFGGWQARDVSIRGDAAGLAAFAPMFAALRPTGAIALTAEHLAWSVDGLRGEAMAEWRGAAIGWSEVRPLGSYRANYEDTGSLFATNAPRAPLPHLVKRTYVFRPGTTSVVDTYFTFRLLDMLEHPTITQGKYVYPAHRTSLWSQLYGRANFVHFDQFPPSWRNTSLLVLTIGRLIFVLALLPTVLMLVVAQPQNPRTESVRCGIELPRRRHDGQAGRSRGCRVAHVHGDGHQAAAHGALNGSAAEQPHANLARLLVDLRPHLPTAAALGHGP
jgi:hypothetical protein